MGMLQNTIIIIETKNNELNYQQNNKCTSIYYTAAAVFTLLPPSLEPAFDSLNKFYNRVQSAPCIY